MYKYREGNAVVHSIFALRIKSSVCIDADFLWSDKFMGRSGIEGVLLDMRGNKTFKY